MTNDEIRKIAKRRLKAKRDFYTYLGIWAALTILLVTIWFFASGGDTYFWPIWPFLGMGIAAIVIGLGAFGMGNRNITDSDIDAEVNRMTTGS